MMVWSYYLDKLLGDNWETLSYMILICENVNYLTVYMYIAATKNYVDEISMFK